MRKYGPLFRCSEEEPEQIEEVVAAGIWGTPTCECWITKNQTMIYTRIERELHSHWARTPHLFLGHSQGGRVDQRRLQVSVPCSRAILPLHTLCHDTLWPALVSTNWELTLVIVTSLCSIRRGIVILQTQLSENSGRCHVSLLVSSTALRGYLLFLTILACIDSFVAVLGVVIRSYLMCMVSWCSSVVLFCLNHFIHAGVRAWELV